MKLNVCDGHLCYKNKGIAIINKALMVSSYKGPSFTSYELKYNTQSQKIIYQIDTPVIGKIYGNISGICKNERFR